MKADDEERPDCLPTVSGPDLGPANLSTSPEIEGYEIIRVLGEGGMGVVYLARQKQPVHRQVALKVIKAGMDSKQVVTRFEAERQALAMLDHPNIAQVYDAGTTKDGHPFFSMEYIDGPTITDYCDQRKFSINDRLEMFMQICEGVQHAHQKGIIHRDIKPSNVLVFTDSDKPLPKIIDFGVAKAITASLTEQTLYTEQGKLVGTPEYMSPEQAEMTKQDIDTRSDVYSLGVLLYVLLTGTLPFDRKTLQKAGFVEILRIVREQEPPRPSTRLWSLAEETTHAAENRQTNRGTLTRLIRGDLDWIVMKSLEKDRNRRYSAAAEFEADIRRHLNSEPVHAGPPTALYKLRKFVKRNRASVVAALVVIVALVIGSIMATFGLAHAVKQRDKAKRSLYSAHMLIARQNWEDGRVAGFWGLLDAYRPRPGEQDLRGWEWYYLNALCNQSLLTLRGHAGAVHCVAWSPDGRYLASAGEDHTIRVWDWLQVKPICVLREHTAQVRSVAWSPDGQRLASASDDETVKIWDWAEGISVLTMNGHKGPVHSVAWSSDGTRLASGGKDSTVSVWNVTTGDKIHHLFSDSRPESVLSVAWSPDGQWLAAGREASGGHGTVTLWETTTLQHHHLRDRKGDGAVYSVAWSADSTLVASTTAQAKIKIWDRTTKEKKFVFRDHTSVITSVAWSSDCRRLLSAGNDQTIKIWDLTEQVVLTTLCGHRTPVNSVTWSPYGHRLASAGNDGTIRIWDATKTREASSERRFDNWVTSVSWSPDGRWLAIAYLKSTVKILDSVTGHEVLTLRGHTARVWCVAWSPDGKRLATASRDKTIKVWDAAGGPPTLTLRGHRELVFFVAWSPDGKKLASTGKDLNVRVWSADTGEAIFAIPTGPLGVGQDVVKASVAWSPDGLRLASAAEHGQIRVWDTRSARPLCTLHSGASEVWSVAWSPDGRQLAAGCGDGTVQVWEVNEKRQVFSVQGHTDRVRSITWSRDSRRLASGSRDETVKIRDATTGEELLSLRGHAGQVTSLAWSPDGCRLASGGFDRWVRIWDASRGYELESDLGVQAKRRILLLGLHSTWEAIHANRLDEATQELNNLQAACDQKDHETRESVQAVTKALVRAYHGRSKTTGQNDNRYVGTIDDYQSALHLDPDYVPALNDLAWLLATCPMAEFRNGNEAIKNAAKACELTGWKDHRYLSTLAAAHAEASDYEAAIKWQKTAIHLLPDDKRPLLQPNYEYRLKQYVSAKTGKPYHQGIVGWWKLDEGSGTNALDSGDHGNHGLLRGSPQWVAGKVGSTLRFDGIDDYIDCGNSDVLNFGIGDWTVSAWMKTEQTSTGTGTIFANGGAYSGGIRYALVLGQRTSGTITLTADDHSVKCEATSSVLVNDDAWHHVLGMRNGIDLLVYIDGVLDGCRTVPEGYDLSGTSQRNAYIGAITDNRDGNLIKHFEGLIDEVKVYSYALTEQEVRELYESTKNRGKE